MTITHQQFAAMEAELAALQATHYSMIDVNHLLLDCVARVAAGKSSDPRLDACNTLRGCGMIATEALQK